MKRKIRDIGGREERFTPGVVIAADPPEKRWTHPTPRDFALAMSAVAAADHCLLSEVTQDGADWLITFEVGQVVRISEGPLQEEYRV